MVNGIKEVWKPPTDLQVPTTIKSNINLNNEIIKSIEQTTTSTTLRIQTKTVPTRLTTIVPTLIIGPYFDEKYSRRNVSVNAMLGKTAYLTCKVKNLGNKTVSNQFLLI